MLIEELGTAQKYRWSKVKPSPFSSFLFLRPPLFSALLSQGFLGDFKEGLNQGILLGR